MLLVNVGSHTINVDHVVAFIDEDDRIEVIFSSGPAGSNSNSRSDDRRFVLSLTGQEADRMRAWLDRNAEGVRGSEQTGFHIG